MRPKNFSKGFAQISESFKQRAKGLKQPSPEDLHLLGVKMTEETIEDMKAKLIEKENSSDDKSPKSN